MPEPRRFTETEILALAGSALVKIDSRGRRGTERVTHDEIEAMAALIVQTGAGFACLETYRAAETVLRQKES